MPRTAKAPPPILTDYEAARATFSWSKARRHALAGLPGGGGLNIAHETVDRHAGGAAGRVTALRFLSRSGSVRDVSYDELSERTSRFANVLRSLGVRPGERVFALAGRIPALYIAALGTLKARSVFAPLFAAFGPEPVRARLDRGGGRVLVTTPELYARKVAGLRDHLPGLRYILLAGGEGRDDPGAGVHDLDRLLATADGRFEVPPTDPEDMALLHFTSGTTGAPKGAVHVHGAILSHHVTAEFALDLRAGDVFWCTADPGWVTGTSYGILGPLSIGSTVVVDEAEFDPDRWAAILEEQGVTAWYTAPTAIRLLMRSGSAAWRLRDRGVLRLVASVGEALNADAVAWGREVLGTPILDNWWQTETGGIMIANYRSMAIRPGSMGRPLPGVEAGLVRRNGAGGVEAIDDPGEQGEIALRPGWPSMFRGYLGDEDRYRACFADGWYLTGDLARRDADGYYWFVGRADDLIKTSGHFVGPFEVESVLLAHPAVAEAAVIGLPDPVAGERVKGFVVLKQGLRDSEDLRLEILGHARSWLGAAIAPKEIDFRDTLPATRSGKILRRLLRARELGLPEGDLSTLEGCDR